jgi:tol-pal system protein YbgF
MNFKTNKKLSVGKYTSIIATLLSLNTLYPAFADATSDAISELNSRIVALEEHAGDSSDKADDANPGAQATKADLESLKEQLRTLQSRIDDTQRLQDEMNLLHDDIKQLKKENASLKNQKISKRETLAPDSEEDNANERKEGESFKGKHAPATQSTSHDLDDEADPIMQLLAKSAPYDDSEEAGDGPVKKKKKDSDLTAIRDAATKKAEDAAPELASGNAEAQYNEAFALFDKGAYREAERAFTYFIKTYPNDPLVSKAIYWKAECCLKQKNHKDAKILFVNAYKKNPSGPKAPDCLLRLGEILAIQGKNEDACTAWRKLRKDFPHMTSEMKTELSALKTTYGCKLQTEETTKAITKKPGAVAR